MKQLGSVNAIFPCMVYKKGVLVAHCIDTPNSVAYAMNKSGGDTAQGYLNNYERNSVDMKDRVKNAGWLLNDKEARAVIL